MRKKTHISLAKGVIHGLDMSDRINHRLSFYLGSIWPDCIPSFLTRRHCIDQTFDIFSDKMLRFIGKFNPKRDMGIASSWRMGVVLHYIADYFTFPHNKHYKGNLREHCAYEEILKKRMYQFIANVRETKFCELLFTLGSTEQIKAYIREEHEQYMSIDGNVDSDCGYSFHACLVVMASLLEIAAGKHMTAVPAAAHA